jgi:molybdopterin converting factor small subunit
LADLYAHGVPTDRIPVAYVRNQRVCAADTPVADGDEVAFLPPLGGG